MLLATNPICRWFLLLIRMRRIWCSIGFGLLMIHRSTQNTVHYDLLLSLTMKRPSRCPSMNRLLVKRNHKSRYNDKLRTIWPIFIDLYWSSLMFTALFFLDLRLSSMAVYCSLFLSVLIFLELYWSSWSFYIVINLNSSLLIYIHFYWYLLIFIDLYWSLMIFLDLLLSLFSLYWSLFILIDLFYRY